MAGSAAAKGVSCGDVEHRVPGRLGGEGGVGCGRTIYASRRCFSWFDSSKTGCNPAVAVRVRLLIQQAFRLNAPAMWRWQDSNLRSSGFCPGALTV